MQVLSNIAALHQRQGRTEIAEGLYRKAASKCKEHVRLKKKDFRAQIIYGQTLINVAVTAIASRGHAPAESDLQRALKVRAPAHTLHRTSAADTGRKGLGEGCVSVRAGAGGCLLRRLVVSACADCRCAREDWRPAVCGAFHGSSAAAGLIKQVDSRRQEQPFSVQQPCAHTDGVQGFYQRARDVAGVRLMV